MTPEKLQLPGIVPPPVADAGRPGRAGAPTNRRADAPLLSIVVASRHERSQLDACLEALLPQCQACGAEVLVVRAAAPAQIGELQSSNPGAQVVSAPPDCSDAQLRAAGMRAAAGDIVALITDRYVASPGWLARLLRAPQGGSEGSGGTREADPRQRTADWAAYLAAHGILAEAGSATSTPLSPAPANVAAKQLVDTTTSSEESLRMTSQQPSAPRSVTQLRAGDRVVIIGAGPGGLTAAYLLAKQGVPVTVLEADDVVGGISRTVKYNGYRFDIGGHRFFTKIEPVEQLWQEILGDEFISVPRLSRIHYNGRFFDYPLKAANALQGLGLVNAFRIVLSYMHAHLDPYPVEENLEQWVSNRFGRRLYEIFFKTYTEKVWGIPCTEIRAEWAAQRIQNLSLASAILNAASLNRRSTKIKTLIDRFQYPRLGPGQMWEMCRDRVVEMGGEVLMCHRVEALELREREVVAVRASTPVGERRIEGEHFISTMPVRSLVQALDPAAPEAIRSSANGLSYRDFLTVALILDQADLFPDNWIYIHTPGVKVGRIQNFNNWSAAMVPEPGRTCLGMEYFCFEGDGLWTSSDEDLIALATREVHELGLADGNKVVDGAVVRMPKAYPVYDSVYRDHLARVQTYVDRIPNLHLVGRNGMHKYNNQDHSMLTAMLTLANMQGASHDVWAVNTDFEYHEEIKLRDPAAAPARPRVAMGAR